MDQPDRKFRFYLAETGEIIHTVTLKEKTPEEKLDEIRLNLAYEKGYEANSIDYEEI